MTRHLLILALTASLLVVVMGSVQAQNKETQADKPAAASAENPFQSFQQFSATLNGGIGRDTNRKIHRSGKLMRIEFADHYRITDLETRKTWMVYPQKCSMFPVADPAAYPFSRKFHVERSPIEEKETVDGHTCKIENLTLVPDSPIPVTIKMKLYEAEDLKGFPIRINSENLTNRTKVTFNYSNVSLEPPDAKLFEHPAKCEGDPHLVPKGVEKANPKAAKPAAKAPPKSAPKPE